MSWAEVRSPVMQRLETFFSRCWLSLITCKIKSSRVLLSFCVTSLLSVHWPEVMSRQKIVSSMCHFLSPCMTLLEETQVYKCVAEFSTFILLNIDFKTLFVLIHKVLQQSDSSSTTHASKWKDNTFKSWSKSKTHILSEVPELWQHTGNKLQQTQPTR